MDRRSLLAGLVPILALAAAPARAQGAPVLFKVISTKDDVVIGLPGGDVEALAKRLVADGQVTAWQYAPRKAANGDLEQAPLRKIAILRQESLRIEPFRSPIKVVPLPP